MVSMRQFVRAGCCAAGGVMLSVSGAVTSAFGQSTDVGGAGVAPGSITVSDAFRGGEYGDTITILNGRADDQRFTLTPQGDVAPWVSFGEKGATTSPFEIVVPQKSQAQVRVAVKVPGDIVNGEYGGLIDIAGTPVGAIPKGDSGASVGVGFAVTLAVKVTGTQHLAASLDNVFVEPGEVGKPLVVHTQITNSGNVGIEPVVDVVVRRNGREVDSFSNRESPTYLDPGSSEAVAAGWDTTNALPGVYSLSVKVTAGELDLGTRELNAELSPLGTLQRSGSLERVEIVGTPAPGGPVKVRGHFRNTGSAAATVVLVSELRDGENLVARQQSLAVQVAPLADAPIDVVFDNVARGRYDLVTTANHDGVDTDPVTLSLGLGVSVGGGSSRSWIVVVAAAAAGALLLGTLLWLLLRRHRRTHPTAPEVVEQPVVDARKPSNPTWSQPLAVPSPDQRLTGDQDVVDLTETHTQAHSSAVRTPPSTSADR
jgi:hypothetical protein